MEVLNAAIRFVIAVIRWGHGKGRQVGIVALVIDSEPQRSSLNPPETLGPVCQPSTTVDRLSRLLTYLLSSTGLHPSFCLLYHIHPTMQYELQICFKFFLLQLTIINLHSKSHDTFLNLKK